MAKNHHHRGEHGHHTPEHGGGHGSKAPKAAKGAHGHKPARGNYVMEGGGDDSQVHPDHKAANAAFGMSGGHDAGADYKMGHDEDDNECCD